LIVASAKGDCMDGFAGGARAWMVGAFVLLAGAALTAAPAAAQSYPSKPIRLVVGFPPGGGIDFTARTIAQYMAEGLGQPIVVENKPGAAGVSAAAEVARAAPDGYTLILANIGPFALAPAMMARPPYDPVRDFTAIGQIVSTYFVAAVPVDLPARNMREFVAWAKANDGKVNFASGGNASITHLNGELLNMVAGLRMTHVPYKGSAPALTDLMAGQTHILIDVGAVLTPQVKAGKLKALAVTSSERDPQLPDVPTMREAGYVELETAGWQGLLGPAGMPKEIVARLSAELNKVLARPDMRQRFADAGAPVTLRGPDEFAAFIRAENQRWLPVIKASGAQID
jgi:tripartite-type tricarboxylate transporter receptor subunit TctC